jgi:hypothetical protein
MDPRLFQLIPAITQALLTIGALIWLWKHPLVSAELPPFKSRLLKYDFQTVSPETIQVAFSHVSPAGKPR